MAEMVREIERKYEAGRHTDLPDLTGLPRVASVDDGGTLTLDAVYYDTADLALATAGVTLRQRLGGDDPGWHLKLPVGRDTRDEIRLPPRASDSVPSQLTRLVRAYTRQASLVPVARLRSVRRVRHLREAAGQPLAVVSYDVVTAEPLGGVGKKTKRWVEIEVELAEGADTSVLDVVERRLSEHGVTRSPAPSKLARALGKHLTRRKAALDEPPSAVVPGSAGEALLSYLREQVRALVRLDPAVRRDLPDAVHQMRVAARRTRSVLSTFRTVFDRDATRKLIEELRWLGGELGVERDREVLTARFQELLDGLPRGTVRGPVRGRLRTWSRTRRSSTRGRVLAALNGGRYLALLDRLDTLLREPPLLPAAGGPAVEVLTGSVLGEYRKLAERVSAARTDEERHEARKAAKRARYAAEASQGVLGASAGEFAARMKRVQEVLGEAQDGVVAKEALRELAAQAERSDESAFTYGVLHEREAQRSEEAVARFGAVWAKASKRKYRAGP